ncbi:MAG: RagB/SusD family nutrient uptake outer membrane protein [Hymenobacter sp.]
MKKLAHYFLPSALLLATLALNGCAKLDEAPESSISPVNFYKTDADFQAAINGAIKPWFSGYGAFDFNNALLLSGGSDDVTSRPTAPSLKAYDEFKADVNGFQAAQEWTLLYKSINACNLIIANLAQNTSISPASRSAYEGQARYLRALAYFHLTRWFGEIPIVTVDNQLTADKAGQATVAQVYQVIVEDLKAAETQLPLTFTEKGRPTRGAAKTLLAEAYLTMAGWPLKDVSKYALARDKAKEVMDGGQYSLEPSYANLWKVSNKLTNHEFIFLFHGTSTASWIEGSHLHVASRPGEEGGWDDMMSEARFFNAFPAGPRKDATFHTVFTDAAHTPWQKSTIGQPYMAKYRDAGAAATADGPVASFDGDGFFVMSRYAEVLLMYAEAANLAEGSPSAAALAAINQVRRRAGGNNPAVYPDLAPGLSQQAFDTAVLAERAWELAFENKRWFDLVRKEKVVEVNKALYPGVSARNQLLPKPQKEIDMIQGLKQNVGY